MTEQTAAFTALRHSTKIHMALANGPSTELCLYLAKLIDVLEDMGGGADPTVVLHHLAFQIINRLADHTLTALGGQLGVAAAQARHALAEAQAVALALADPVAARPLLFQALCAAVDHLAQITGADYPRLAEIGKE